MHGFWPIFFLAVVLKIPVAGLLYIVWWAVNQTPETEEAPPASRRPRVPALRRQPAARASRAAAPTRPTRCRSPTARPPAASGC